MDQVEVLAALADLPLGGLRFFSQIGSTNDEALNWAAQRGPDLAIVVADEQTAGRGRAGRAWHTPSGSALALSVILRPSNAELGAPARLTGLGALAVVQCCRELGMQAQIKWPNDVLLRGKKVAGILVESEWAGNSLNASIMGIGVNVNSAAIPPNEVLSFPATSLESELGRPLRQVDVLRHVVGAVLEWRSRIGTPDFVRAWEDALVFRFQQVVVSTDTGEPLHGKLLGLERDGSLRLMVGNLPRIVHFGEIHLRPSNDKIG
jgi:BirA family transcriptional regulator, biotin operon repressor / biotin---[acetyl-CoA-carboxylase] ligase